jgi:hypothetical protein
MKCDVSNCKFNKNNTCSNIDNLEIMDTGEGIICGTYEESIESKRSSYELIIHSDGHYGRVLMFHTKTIYGISNLEEINKDIDNYCKADDSNMVIIDLTLRVGTKGENRYVTFNKDKWENIEDKELLKYLKSKTCEYLRENENLLNYSILASTQIKMIKKGIVI